MSEKKKTAGKIINLPNTLTLIRIGLVPLIVVFILIQWSDKIAWNIITACVFVIAALTDLFDGAIARGTNQVTNFGKFLDPIADKMLILGSLIALSGSARFSYLSLALVVSSLIILLREFTITSIRMVASREDGTVISANFAGKFKTAFSCAAVVIILLEEVVFRDGGLLGVHLLSYAALAISVILTLWSGVTYMIKYFTYIDPRR
ncbi:MAG: CDP-diacylglycerol--glycerol-3-phosphate 3-phosphatidyltransferase [Clostridia bacterium]|nr:CDP-diacylglycerol--glycerol-3-phosphate 3-phosphatidyltransferase [Clostridia bacterium]